MVRVLACLLLVFSSIGLTAQTSVAAPDLKEPDALFVSARATNSLTDDDMKPWHLKASYEIFDDYGKPLGRGVFEEWWAAKDKWKRSFDGDHYTGITYHSSAGYAQEGGLVPWPESLIVDAVIQPIQRQANAPAKFSAIGPRKVMDLHLSCIDVNYRIRETLRGYPPYKYCFDAGTDTLRISQDQFVFTFFDLCSKFQGHQIGMKTVIEVNEKAVAKVQVDSITEDSNVDVMLTPDKPLTFKPVLSVRYSGSGVIPPQQLVSKYPVCPHSIMDHRLNAKVVARLVVDVDGKVVDVHALASPDPLFTQSAIDAVRGYRFKPAQQAGQAVAAQVIAVIDFKECP